MIKFFIRLSDFIDEVLLKLFPHIRRNAEIRAAKLAQLNVDDFVVADIMDIMDWGERTASSHIRSCVRQGHFIELPNGHYALVQREEAHENV